ncbi:hypothetical protein EDD18DRAFT_1367009 [Armillaria luteobubalina]|uniref:CxC2-like cysteine cluster KDZ transposase-associated domain-containing protein n=1 Tax=Armillaria luteobubalina TaxID=153913 RepID=A0AA39P139_9AGAR|nr:hypothetical protein EDD18DRAFT_1367009 [Armillaria luteobubalina]
MPPKQKQSHVSRADDEDGTLLTQICACTISVQKGRRRHLKVAPQALPIHRNPVFSQGDWVYQDHAYDYYDLQVKARLCQLEQPKTKRNEKSDWPLRYWMDNYRQETLDEFIRLEGRGDPDAQEFCLSCMSLECGECTVAKHRDNPFHVLELLRAELFPATVDQPKTCASFRLLEQFHALSGLGKISVYEYHNALKHLTDATGVSKLKCKYKSLLRLGRQFPHMKFTKRAGRGSVPNGIETTIAGGLALRCPACPHPGINLPADWDSAPLEYQFLYMLILALDANFRLKNLYRSSWEKDPGLHMGLAHFIEPTRYLEHVRQYATQKDISSCSGFKTLSHAETKSAVGLRATGIGMVVCACHEVIQPLAIADLQRGERYCNMDYIALSALKDSTAKEYQVKTVFFSYDIACQWKKKFRERMAAFLPEMHIPSRIDLHMNIHTVGRTDSEGIERCWAEINVMANSTKEMGLGNRYNTLDVQFAWHNWKKIVGLGKSLARRHVKARHKSSWHVGAFLALSEVLPDSSLKQDWTAEIEAWERDNSLPSPYFIDVKHLSEARVVLTLKEEERQAALSDGVDIEDSSATACIEVALTVEDLHFADDAFARIYKTKKMKSVWAQRRTYRRNG